MESADRRMHLKERTFLPISFGDSWTMMSIVMLGSQGWGGEGKGLGKETRLGRRRQLACVELRQDGASDGWLPSAHLSNLGTDSKDGGVRGTGYHLTGHAHAKN